MVECPVRHVSSVVGRQYGLARSRPRSVSLPPTGITTTTAEGVPRGSPRLRQRTGSGVGARGADAGTDLVDQILHSRPNGIEIHPRRGDALLIEALAGSIERRFSRRPVGDRPRRGHPEGHFERAAVGVQQQVTRGLVGAREPRADHHRGGTGREGERDVSWMPDTAIGPNMLAEIRGRLGALVDRRELRATDTGHHASRAPRARTDTDLDDVGARRDQGARALGGNDIPRDDRDRRCLPAHGRKSFDHPVLMTVSGVDDEAIHTDVEQGTRLASDIAIDPQRCRDPQTARRIHRGRVDRGPQSAGPRQHSDELAVSIDGHHQRCVGGAIKKIERLPG